MKHGSLFSGIGGFDLAAEWMGWENVFHCEWNEFGQKILKYYWPGADSYTDITKTDFTKYANKIDILTGGFPCQPFSLAGKRKGADDERYLWHEMLRAIREIKPKWVIAENVFGITNIDGGLVFEQVCLDLEAEGYEVQPFIIPAASKNAPHRRDRCWFIAQNPLHSGCLHGESNQERAEVRKFGDTCTGSADRVHLSKGDVANPNGNGQHKCNCNNEINASKRWINALGDIEQSNGNGNASDTESVCIQRFSNGQGQKQFGRSDWSRFPTQSPICGGDDGLPTELDRITFPKWRNESIKAYGNAVVPQVAYEIFKSIKNI